MKIFLIGGGAKARCVDVTQIKREDEVWAINGQLAYEKLGLNCDRMFNVHRYELLVRYGFPVREFASWARDNGRNTRVFVADKWPDKRMARAEIFPREELQKYPRGDYHCNSLDWLILYALHCGAKALHIHGFRNEQEGIMEQMSSPKCAEYWAGYATAMGMEIVVGDDSAMFGVYHITKTNRVYGYDDCPAYEDKTRADDTPYRFDDY